MLNMSVGRQDFKKMVDQKNSPYVDKTHLIEDVLSEDVVLYTRPRRFGKTLNMSMLYYFFSNREKDNAYLFNNLRVCSNKEVMKHLNQYPIINLTFGGLENLTFVEQTKGIGMIIGDFIENHSELRTSEHLSDYQKERLYRLETNTYDDNELKEALFFLSKCLYLHDHKKVIILIDEYDVPLNFAKGKYYDEFQNFYSIFLSKGLKYNDYLERGVLSGCLSFSKNSSFTGLNNVKVRSIMDYKASGCFGFTQDEVDELLRKADLLEKREIIRDWYNGYRIGNSEIYNPWSVCEYIDVLQRNSDEEPGNYWLNTGSNREIYEYIINGDEELKNEFRRLIEGETLTKRIDPYLTHRDLIHHNPTNIYSFLLFTGYLKIISPAYDNHGKRIRNTYHLCIPNKEVREIYEEYFSNWFNETYHNYNQMFVDALLNKDAIKANNILDASLFETLSYYDYNESFYHGYMANLLKTDGYMVESNIESGLGRYDLFIHKNDYESASLLIECKYSNSRENLYEDSLKGINQIIERKYIEGLISKGYSHIIAYCISFYKKECHIELMK